MMHDNRVWVVATVTTAEELAEKLTRITWTCSRGFELGGYFWLNDATSPEGGQEYGVVKKVGRGGRPMQIESITFSWCSYAALQHIRRTLRGEDDDNDFAHMVSPHLERPEEHGRCPHCA